MPRSKPPRRSSSSLPRTTGNAITAETDRPTSEQEADAERLERFIQIYYAGRVAEVPEETIVDIITQTLISFGRNLAGDEKRFLELAKKAFRKLFGPPTGHRRSVKWRCFLALTKAHLKAGLGLPPNHEMLLLHRQHWQAGLLPPHAPHVRPPQRRLVAMIRSNPLADPLLRNIGVSTARQYARAWELEMYPRDPDPIKDRRGRPKQPRSPR